MPTYPDRQRRASLSGVFHPGADRYVKCIIALIWLGQHRAKLGHYPFREAVGAEAFELRKGLLGKVV